MYVVLGGKWGVDKSLYYSNLVYYIVKSSYDLER